MHSYAFSETVISRAKLADRKTFRNESSARETFFEGVTERGQLFLDQLTARSNFFSGCLFTLSQSERRIFRLVRAESLARRCRKRKPIAGEAKQKLQPRTSFPRCCDYFPTAADRRQESNSPRPTKFHLSDPPLHFL